MLEKTLIAGEPLEVLERLLPDIRYERRADGGLTVAFTTDLETGAAWRRAIERRAADFITEPYEEPIESRYAGAFIELVKEVATALRTARQ